MLVHILDCKTYKFKKHVIVKRAHHVIICDKKGRQILVVRLECSWKILSRILWSSYSRYLD